MNAHQPIPSVEPPQTGASAMDANLHPLFKATLDAFCAPVATRNQDQESARDTSWDEFCARVDTESGRELDSAEDFEAAWIAFRKGVTASDYALEVVARAAAMEIL